MSATDNLQASFRGIPFYLESDTQTNGRRLAVQSIPGRDNPYIADLGRKTRPYTINGRVIGDDYIEQLKRLQTASEKEGPAEYIDPNFGKKNVSVENFSFTLIDSEKRVAHFSFSFVEYDDADNKPTASVDTKTKSKQASESLISTAKEEFVKKFSIQSKPAYLVEKSLKNVNNTLAKVKDKLFVFNAIDEFNYTLNRVLDETNTLISTPESLADSILSLLSVTDSVYSLINKIDDLLDLFDSVDIELIPTSSGNDITYVNNNQFSSFLKSAIIANIALLTLDADFKTYNDALLYNDKISTAIETIEPLVIDSVYERLYSVKTAVSRDLSNRFIDFPRISTITLNESAPSIVVAYQLYNSIDKADEIVARNKLVHPGFIPAGVPIMVVSNE